MTVFDDNSIFKKELVTYVYVCVLRWALSLS